MKHLTLLSFIMPALMFLSGTTNNAVTHRTAQVQILNNTGKVINYAKVYHKYSDVYKNMQEWNHIGISARSSSMKVDYNTGFGTTGRDWWLVVWTTEHGSNSALLSYTNPQNARSFIDGFEMVWKEVTPVMVAGVVGTSCLVAGCGPAAPFAAMAGAAVSSQIFGRMMNGESTAGFKQHILTSEDENLVTTIHLNSDGSVLFESKSGKSRTNAKQTVMHNNGVSVTPASTSLASQTGTLTYGAPYYIRNQYGPGSYLDTCGHATCTSGTKYGVVTNEQPNREGSETGTWVPMSANGKQNGEPIRSGDIVYLKNVYGGGTYLDSCGHASCTAGTKYGVCTNENPNRGNENTGQWQIIGINKSTGQTLSANDKVYLKNIYGGGTYLDTCNTAECTAGTLYGVVTHQEANRGGAGTGTWMLQQASQ